MQDGIPSSLPNEGLQYSSNFCCKQWPNKSSSHPNSMRKDFGEYKNTKHSSVKGGGQKAGHFGCIFICKWFFTSPSLCLQVLHLGAYHHIMKGRTSAQVQVGTLLSMKTIGLHWKQ